MNKESFLLFKSFYEPIKHLSNEHKGLLLDAIFQYQIDRTEIGSDSPIYMPFLFFKNQFRLDEVKYLATCKKNKDNGSMGGRPPKQEPEPYFGETQNNPNNPTVISEPKEPDNDKGNGKENGNEKEKKEKGVYGKKEEKIKLAENITVTTKQQTELIKQLGARLDYFVNEVSTYKTMTGKKYNDDYLAILNFKRRQDENPKNKPTTYTVTTGPKLAFD